MTAELTAGREYSKNSGLLELAIRGDPYAEEELVKLNTGLVKSIARRFIGRGTDVEDLIQIGTIGLIKAIRSFEPDKGFAFSTYAVPLIVGEIKRSLRDDGLIKVGRKQKKLGMDIISARSRIMNEEGRDVRISELAEICGVGVEEAAMALDSVSPIASFSDSIDTDGEMTLESRLADPEDEIAATTNRVALTQAIDKLDPLWKKIILMRYFRDYTQQKTAEALGISQVKVSREEKKILEFLKNELI